MVTGNETLAPYGGRENGHGKLAGLNAMICSAPLILHHQIMSRLRNMNGRPRQTGRNWRWLTNESWHALTSILALHQNPQNHIESRCSNCSRPTRLTVRLTLKVLLSGDTMTHPLTTYLRFFVMLFHLFPPIGQLKINRTKG
jgi:hypothetical protein